MSRSGYTDDNEDDWSLIRWRGAVNSAIRGKRGQAFLRELVDALDAMPVKALTSGELQADGEFCALGVVGNERGLALEHIDTDDWAQLSKEFGIAEAMAREIMFENDECVDDTRSVEVEICGPVRPRYPEWGSHKRWVIVPVDGVAERRWRHMRDWAAKQIVASNPAARSGRAK